jgi:hypothetical protein
MEEPILVSKEDYDKVTKWYDHEVMTTRLKKALVVTGLVLIAGVTVFVIVVGTDAWIKELSKSVVIVPENQ